MRGSKTIAALIGALLGVLGAALPVNASVAPKPLYRDPVYDGAADASIVYDRHARTWMMFYTNRRATLTHDDPKDVSWVHGTAIGMATSRDGQSWTYAGVADIPAACTGATLWAPELYEEDGTYHMWLTVVPGVFKTWQGDRRIVHLTSKDLKSWSCGDALDLGSDRVIDASIIKFNDGYRLWFKDERKGSRLFAADSPDMIHWTRHDTPVVDMAAEGPKIFRFHGYYWMIADAWKGLIVLRSSDAQTWTLQDARLLETPGTQPTDTSKGQHPDIVVTGDHAYLFYFVHQGNEPQAQADPFYAQRTVIQVGELLFKDGQLSIDRNAAVDVRFTAP
ncbi:family 43 glycosylhydrolase [Asticcacaulis sp. 201]|uniref:family 43 glycosylhydrolase n=1 Tax=Asticcacaulis sp. 201 TaxID=3028787 RepID=UPI002916196E|nr:family 43 glycosylhydrolase [Asticcacaulis sp. 201]MDV6332870.1 family 43 glycosylhydrolase [Asticcacaulis sp. 201]